MAKSDERLDGPPTALRDLVAQAARRRKFVAYPDVAVGSKPTGGPYVVDFELVDVKDPARRALVVSKFQDVRDASEEQLTHEVVKLVRALRTSADYRTAFLVLEGGGFSRGMIRFLRTQIHGIIAGSDAVQVVTIDEVTSQTFSIPKP